MSLDADKTPGQIVGPTPAPIVGPASAHRSYLVETSSGLLRRNRSHLTEIPDNPEPNEELTPQDLPPSLPQPEPETGTQKSSGYTFPYRNCYQTYISCEDLLRGFISIEVQVVVLDEKISSAVSARIR